jgi:sulfur-oxidizing protein SoxX
MTPVALRLGVPMVAAAALALTGAGGAMAAAPAAAGTATAGEDGLLEPLTATAGSAERGRALVAQRQLSQCLLCHQAPLEVPFQGDISTNLAGAGARWTAAQLRQRLVNPRRQNPASIMPAYFETAPRNRVGAAWRDKTILDAQQIEDVIAWLQTLR